MGRSTLDSTEYSVLGSDVPPADVDRLSSVPVVGAKIPQVPDGLPPAGSACRFCGGRAAADATRYGGVKRVDDNVSPPADARDVRSVRVQTVGSHMSDDPQVRMGRLVRQFVIPHWRVCADCEPLTTATSTVALLSAALGEQVPGDPVTLHVAGRFEGLYAYTMGARRTDAGATPWAHVNVRAIREEITRLRDAGGLAHPSGLCCGVCGRSNSPYGWEEDLWIPQDDDYQGPRLPLCGGTRNVHRPEAARWMRWQRVATGCATLVRASRLGLSEPLGQLACREGHAAGKVADGWYWQIADRRRALAYSHPEFRAQANREPWWYLADAPLRPLSTEEQLMERLARLEAERAA